jgi:hypothetical protein
MNTTTESSAIVPIFDYTFPKKGEALVESAIMGYGVICYDRGTFYVVWWEDDQACDVPLSWGIPNYLDVHVEVEVA